MTEPQKSFRDARLKIEWADKQIDNLELLHNAFIEEYAQIGLVEENRETDFREFRLDIDPVPIEMKLIAGDVVRNLRGALEYCWSGLDRARTGGIDSSANLPISATNRKSIRTSVENTDVGKAFPDTVELLEELNVHSDFADEGNTPLIAINRLSNWEKHNLLMLVSDEVSGGIYQVGAATFTLGNLGSAERLRELGISLFGITGPGKDSTQIHRKGNTSARIVLGNHPRIEFLRGEPLFPLVRQLSQAATEVVEAFAKRFV